MGRQSRRHLGQRKLKRKVQQSVMKIEIENVKEDEIYWLVVKLDQATISREKLMFARVMVEVQVNQSLPDVISIDNELGNVIENNLEYEWRPIVCIGCGVVGHVEEKCTTKVKKVWVLKSKRVEMDEEGFFIVTCGKPGCSVKITQPTQSQNSMNKLSALMNEVAIVEEDSEEEMLMEDSSGSKLWMECFDDIEVTFLPKGTFDHSTMVLKHRELKCLKKMFRALNKEVFGDITAQDQLSFQKMLEIQEKMHSNPFIDQIREEEKAAVQEYDRAQKAYLIFLRQEVNLVWLVARDEKLISFIKASSLARAIIEYFEF
ncbi:Receptor-mediated endocytosis protein 6-like protein [Bienertia sinuspersici]